MPAEIPKRSSCRLGPISNIIFSKRKINLLSDFLIIYFFINSLVNRVDFSERDNSSFDKSFVNLITFE